jgi:aminoglycoside 6-adenylyltransferase
VTEGKVLDRLVAWGEAEPAVRAMILTSSRARADESVDRFSDYDVIAAVAGIDDFVRDDGWIRAYGDPMVRWGDEDELYGLKTYFRGVVYRDGVRIDYTLWPDALLDRVALQADLPEGLDVGYRVLLDKVGRTESWPQPTLTAHIPARPTEEAYRALVEEFWWDSTYVAKALWRNELLPAKFALDYDMKLGALRRMLEWRIEIDHDWSVTPGKLGRGLARALPAELWAELMGTYVGADLEDNWDALFRTNAIFRRVATDVGERLGYAYPQDVDEGVTAYLNAIRDLRRR